MRPILEQLFAAVVEETKTNPQFAERIAGILARSTGDSLPVQDRPAPRARNRRQRAVLDPYAELAHGTDHLRQRLVGLSLDQLKDIVSEHAIDSSRLALKWRSQERLVELILNTVSARIEKGSVFRDQRLG